jgi:nucleotide sugar dehydrogenase
MTDLVVMGLGYVGLPLVQEACRSGLSVTGLDVSQRVVDSLNAGRSHVDDLSDDDVVTILNRGFKATTDPSVLSDASTIVICVPTPLSVDGGPDLWAVQSACSTARRYLSPGTLVVLESTTWPGTTEEVVRPLLEESGMRAGKDFYLAFSPERIDPGNPAYHLRNTPKVVGGLSGRCAEEASRFYSRLVDSVVVAKGCREAEMAKLLENTYRHINIALVNEMLKFSNELEVDFWDVMRCAATKPFGFQSFRPGPGVGGHCIPIDPNYLSHRVRARLGYPFRFVELAQEINRSMPGYVASRAQDLLNERQKCLNGSSVLLLGVGYKPGISDQRESPAIPLAELLLKKGANVSFYDALIQEWTVSGTTIPLENDLRKALSNADIVVHLQPHTDYDDSVLAEVTTCLLDTTGQLTQRSGVVRL